MDVRLSLHTRCDHLCLQSAVRIVAVCEHERVGSPAGRSGRLERRRVPQQSVLPLQGHCRRCHLHPVGSTQRSGTNLA